MKHIYLLFLAVFAMPAAQGQIVDIPDANFKNALVNTPCVSFSEYGWDLVDADTNDDGEIQVSEAEAVQKLSLYMTNVSSIEGIEYFTNIKSLYCENTPIKSVDLSNNLNLNTISFYEMDQLIGIYIKNGVDNSYVDPYIGEGGLYAEMCPNLVYVCADDFEITGIQERVGSGVTVNAYCASETAGDVAYIINGKNILDSNLNGCDVNDSFIPNLSYEISNGTEHAIVVTDYQGNFSFPAQTGVHTITPVMPEPNNPDYYIATPANSSINFPADSSPTNIEFCMTTNQDAIIYIPDSNFKNILVNTSCWDSDGNGVVNNNDTDVDTNNDGEIQVSEAETVEYLRFSTRDTNNLIGLEKFINLKHLVCSPSLNGSIEHSNLYSIDVSRMLDLEILDISDNKISSLDVSNNVNLSVLDCSENHLPELDLSNNINLTSLICSNYIEPIDYYSDSYDNYISVLDISNNINLTTLDCSNALTNNGVINFGSLSNLTSINISENNIGVIDLSQFPNLTELKCYNSNLSELDVSQNLNLTKLHCNNDPYYRYPYGYSEWNYDYDLGNDNTLTTLDVSQNTQLTELRCYRNEIATLNIGQNTNLISIACEYNEISSLDVSNCMSLTSLKSFDNQLTTLNFTNTPSLQFLDCSNNQLSELDVSQNLALGSLKCSNNQLSELDTSLNTGLGYLYCNSNQLTVLDLNQNTQLGWLYALANPLTHIYVKNESQFTTSYFEGEYLYRFYFDTTNLEYICADDFELNNILNAYPEVSGILDSSCSTLGIEDFGTNSYSIYPNPVSDVLNIKTTEAIESVSIYDISGRLINEVSFIGNQIDVSITTEHLSQGTYFAKVKTTNSEGVRKIVKE